MAEQQKLMHISNKRYIVKGEEFEHLLQYIGTCPLNFLYFNEGMLTYMKKLASDMQHKGVVEIFDKSEIEAKLVPITK